jgi:hypothetical protein
LRSRLWLKKGGPSSCSSELTTKADAQHTRLQYYMLAVTSTGCWLVECNGVDCLDAVVDIKPTAHAVLTRN